jgi:hypothetical protein
MHDLTMRVDAAARAPTRLTAACRYNSRSTRGAADDTPVGAMRYDVQVYQGVPYLKNEMAQVELVFGVGNLLAAADSIASPTTSCWSSVLRPGWSAASPSSSRNEPGCKRASSSTLAAREGNTSHPND